MTTRVIRRGAVNAEQLALRDAHVEAVAREVFTSRGYGGATIDEIARKASVAKRTLYKTYGGKAGLFAMVVRASADPAPPTVSLDRFDTAEAALNAVVGNMVTAPRAERGIQLLRMVIADAPAQPELAKEVNASGRLETLRAMRRIFSDLIERGLLPPGDASAAAELFVDMVLGGAMLLRLCGFEEDLDRLIAVRIAHFVRAAPWTTTV